MFFYRVLTPISNTSGLWSTGNTRKYHQIDVYIYQCVFRIFRVMTFISTWRVLLAVCQRFWRALLATTPSGANRYLLQGCGEEWQMNPGSQTSKFLENIKERATNGPSAKRQLIGASLVGWATNVPSAKRQLIGVSLVGRWWPERWQIKLVGF